jgi:hypothetical protein
MTINNIRRNKMKLHKVLEIADTAMLYYLAQLNDAYKKTKGSTSILTSLKEAERAHVEIRTMAIKAKVESEN